VVGGGVPRIFVGVHGALGSLHALRRAVVETRRRDGVLYSVIAWTPPGGEMIDRRVPEPHLRRVWTSAAMRTLRAAWDDAFGGIPDDLPVQLCAEQGTPGRVLTGLADSDDDLIVVGAGRPNPVRRALRPCVARYCVAHATCPVLVVPRSSLARQLDHRHRWEMSDLLDNLA
jgi:nucleotide-binding universal stress UspA family protein